MKYNEDEEELLEALYIFQIEEGPSGAPVSTLPAHAVSRLIMNGVVLQHDDGLTLTSIGLDSARLVVRRHRLAERLISDILRAGDQRMHEHACKFEHIIDQELEASICTLLGHPTVCPHGKPIPAGACCKAEATELSPVITALSKMSNGQHGEVVYLHSNDKDIINKLMALGVVPGSRVELIKHNPSYAFQAGESQFAVDRGIAESIFVRIDDLPLLDPGLDRGSKGFRKSRFRRKAGDRNGQSS
ncbi:MAG: metal-dependent transcriptional regulator [Spirochaetales bacterium]|jgi:DtxR family transcriptional regulator, Mn-dependent transcriptional regulator|nr:metal-dependent transcriptional regulator [Spirochaetales bacterium]